jgi:hypothetical protein
MRTVKRVAAIVLVTLAFLALAMLPAFADYVGPTPTPVPSTAKPVVLGEQFHRPLVGGETTAVTGADVEGAVIIGAAGIAIGLGLRRVSRASAK